MGKKRTFKVGEDVYDVEDSVVEEFIKKAPKAIEVKSFTVDNDTFDVELPQVEAFLKAAPQAKPLFTESIEVESTPPTPQEQTPPLGLDSILPPVVAGRDPLDPNENESFNPPPSSPEPPPTPEPPRVEVTRQQRDAITRSALKVPKDIRDNPVFGTRYIKDVSARTGINEQAVKQIYEQGVNDENKYIELKSQYDITPNDSPDKNMQLHEMGQLLINLGRYDEAIEAYKGMEKRLFDQGIAEYKPGMPPNYVDQKQVPAFIGVMNAVYGKGDMKEYERLLKIAELKGIDLSGMPMVGGGDTVQPGNEMTYMGDKMVPVGTPDKGVKSRTSKSDYINSIADALSSLTGFPQMESMTIHGAEKFGKYFKDEFMNPKRGWNPWSQYMVDEQGKERSSFSNYLGMLTGAVETVLAPAMYSTPGGVATGSALMQLPPQAQELIMPVSLLARKYYGEGKVPENIENIGVLADLLVAAGAHVGAKKVGKIRTMSELMREIEKIPEAEVRMLFEQADKRYKESGLPPESYAQEVLKKAKVVENEVRTIEESMPVEPYNPEPAPESLRTVPEGVDVEYNGEIGKLERGDDGTWYFVNDEGKSTQIPVEDKFNPTEKLTELGIQVMPEISKEAVARAVADREQVGEVEYRGKKYFVSLDNPMNDAPTGDLVFERTADGRLLNRFDSHPDPVFAEQRKLAIVNKYLADKSLPARSKLIEPWKEVDGEFKNRVFDKNVQLGEAPKNAHISEEGYNYRTLSEKELEAIKETGGVYPREGKQKGGNKNTKYWTKGNNENWYGDKEGVETIRVKQDKFNENKVVQAEDVWVLNKQTGKFEPLIKTEISTKNTKQSPSTPVSAEIAPEDAVTPEGVKKMRSSKETNIEALTDPSKGLARVVGKIVDNAQPYIDKFLNSIGMTLEEYTKLPDEKKRNIDEKWRASDEYKKLQEETLTPQKNASTKSSSMEVVGNQASRTTPQVAEGTAKEVQKPAKKEKPLTPAQEHKKLVRQAKMMTPVNFRQAVLQFMLSRGVSISRADAMRYTGFGPKDFPKFSVGKNGMSMHKVWEAMKNDPDVAHLIPDDDHQFNNDFFDVLTEYSKIDDMWADLLENAKEGEWRDMGFESPEAYERELLGRMEAAKEGIVYEDIPSELIDQIIKEVDQMPNEAVEQMLKDLDENAPKEPYEETTNTTTEEVIADSEARSTKGEDLYEIAREQQERDALKSREEELAQAQKDYDKARQVLEEKRKVIDERIAKEQQQELFESEKPENPLEADVDVTAREQALAKEKAQLEEAKQRLKDIQGKRKAEALKKIDDFEQWALNLPGIKDMSGGAKKAGIGAAEVVKGITDIVRKSVEAGFDIADAVADAIEKYKRLAPEIIEAITEDAIRKQFGVGGKKFTINGKSDFYHASGRKRVGRLQKNNSKQFGSAVYFSTNKDLVIGEFGKHLTKAKLQLEKPVFTNTPEWEKVTRRAIEMADEEYIKENKIELSEDDNYAYYDPDDLSNIDEIPSKFISKAAEEFGYDAIVDRESSSYDNEIAVLDESKIIYEEPSDVIQNSNTESKKSQAIKKIDAFEQWALNLPGIKDASGGAAKAGLGAAEVIKGITEVVRKAVEAGFDIADAVHDAIEKYKRISPEFFNNVTEDAILTRFGVEKEMFAAKNKATAKLRDKLGIPQDVEVTAQNKRDFSQVMENAKKLREQGADPKDIADRIVRDGYMVSAEEQHLLVENEIALYNERREIEKKLEKIDPNKIERGEEHYKLFERLDEIQAEQGLMFAALERAGREQSLVFRMRQLAMNREYSVQAFVSNYKARTGQEPTPQQIKEAERLEREIRDTEARRAELEYKAKEEEMQGIIEDLREELERERVRKKGGLTKEKQARKVELKKKFSGMFNDATNIPALLADKEFIEYAGLILEEAVNDIGAFTRKLVEELGPKIEPHAKEIFDRVNKRQYNPPYMENSRLRLDSNMLKSVIEAGVKDHKDFLAKVHEIVKQEFPDITEREVADAISGYGKTINPTLDAITKQLNSLKRDLKLASGLEDVRAGKGVLRSGYRPPEYTDEQRQVMREIREELKNYPEDEASTQKKWTTALGKIKKTLENSIRDTEARIKALEQGLPVESKERKRVLLDERAQQLKEQLEDLKKRAKELEGPKTVSDEQLVRNAIAAMERSEREYNRRTQEIRQTGRYTPTNRRVVSDPELDIARQARDMAKEEFDHALSTTDYPAQAATQKALAAAEDRLSELENKIARSDLSYRQRAINLVDQSNPMLVAAKEKIKTQQAILKAMREASGEAERHMQELWTTRKENSIKELKRKLDEKDYTKKVRKETPLTEEMIRLKAKEDRLKFDFEVAIERARLEGRGTKEKVYDMINDIGALPKALNASLDLSAVLRQGAILSARHPVRAAKGFVEMLRQAGSKKRYDQWHTDLVNSDEYVVAKRSGLFINEPMAKLAAREEMFASKIADFIPGTAASNRAYSSYLNIMRMEAFNAFRKMLVDKGYKGEGLQRELTNYATFINDATGRGSLKFGGKNLELAAPLLNAFFFSPRFASSRFRLLTTHTIGALATSPRARMATYRALGQYALSVATTLYLLKLNGAEVSLDPLSSDFGKARFGDTTYDLMSGLQQPFVLMARLKEGAYTDRRGERKKLNNGDLTYNKLIANYLASKASPALSMGLAAGSGEFYDREKFELSKLPERMLVPLILQDLRRMYGEENLNVDQVNWSPTGAERAAKNLPALMLGIGVNYQPEIPDVKNAQFSPKVKELIKKHKYKPEGTNDRSYYLDNEVKEITDEEMEKIEVLRAKYAGEMINQRADMDMFDGLTQKAFDRKMNKYYNQALKKAKNEVLPAGWKDRKKITDED